MARLPTNYTQLEDEYKDVLQAEDYNEIERKAKVLELAECFDYLMVDPKDLNKDSLEAAKRIWTRGRMHAIHTAGDRLFSQMQQRGGAQASLDYLRQMSGTFQAEITPTSGSGFKFNVVIDPEDK